MRTSTTHWGIFPFILLCGYRIERWVYNKRKILKEKKQNTEPRWINIAIAVGSYTLSMNGILYDFAIKVHTENKVKKVREGGRVRINGKMAYNTAGKEEKGCLLHWLYY